VKNIEKEFLEFYGFTFIERENPKLVKLNLEEIQDGSLLTAYTFSGSHLLIMFGSGGRTGHNALVMWEDGQPYVYEASVINFNIGRNSKIKMG
jgi:hypothetical protein